MADCRVPEGGLITHQVPHRRRRGAVIATVLGVALLVAPACGRLSRHISGGSAPTRKGILAVSPATGTAGTAFSLNAGGFKPGEPMTFEIDVPGQHPFVGPPHTAAADGTVSSTYTPLKADPPGTYQVKATGSLGTRAQAQVVVSGRAP